jgi:hypothetical protein
MTITSRRWLLLAVLGFALGLHAETLPPTDVNVAGALDYGQTSNPMQYTGPPRYSALVFNGQSGDQIEVTVKADRKAQVALADGSLKVLASGSSPLSFTLPNRGSDPETYYILFRDANGQAGSFTIALQRRNK